MKFTIPMDLVVDGSITVQGDIVESGTMEVSAASAMMTGGAGVGTNCYICDWFLANLDTLNLMLSCYAPAIPLGQPRQAPYGLWELPDPRLDNK